MKITIKELKEVIKAVVHEAKANLKVAPDWAPQTGDTVIVRIEHNVVKFEVIKVTDVIHVDGDTTIAYKTRPVDGTLITTKIVDLVLSQNPDEESLHWNRKANREQLDGKQSFFRVRLADVIDVVKGSPPTPLADVTKFNKPELLCYVLFVNGTLREDQALEKVAALEGKPYVPGSNHDYFYTSPYYASTGKGNIVSNGLAEKIGKGKSASYVVTPKGIAIAKRVIDAIGADVGRV